MARDRDSAGRLLRVLQDCELFHMEAAIASLDGVKHGIRSDSLLKSSGGDAVDVLERTAEGRVLSLSDHKKIARLQAALSTVGKAYDTQGDVDFTAEADAGRNLVCTVAGAAMMQSTRDCTASRANCCIWGPQAEKLHVLLDWMMNRESVVESSASSDGFVRQLLLEWIQSTAEKQNQLAACLALFELLQRHRRKWVGLNPGSEIVCLLGERVGDYLDALREVVDRGTVRVAGSHRVKPSKLALVALETMALLSGDIAAQFMTADDSAKSHLIDNGLMCKAVEAMRFFLKAQLEWHSNTTRRQFLVYVLRHLQSYVEACDAVLQPLTGNGDDSSRDHGSQSVVALCVLCWHWEATAPLFCTRSDAATRIQQNQPTEMFVRVLKKWGADDLYSKHNPASPEAIYAQIHYVCALVDSMGGVKECLKAFRSFSADTKAFFVFNVIGGMSTAVKNGDEAAVLFVAKVLRAVFSASSGLGLLSMKDEEQEVLSQLLRMHGNARMPYGSSGSVELEFLVADFIISRALFITELVRRAEDSHNGNRQSSISLVRTFLYQLDSSSSQTTLCQHWRRQLAPAVLSCIDAEDYLTRQLALSCLPSLDVVSCVARLCVAGIRGSETYVVTSALGYLFASSTQTSLKAMSSWLIDACQFGSVPTDPIRENPPASPSEWNTFACQLEGSSKDSREEEVRKEVQEKLLSLCFGPKGWSHRVQAANARREIIGVLLQKIFGSPRDTMLLRLLREFVGCGWVDGDVFGPIETQISTHMMNLQRLTEEFLDDNSSSSAKAVEGLLFARLAPLLVLRMIPRDVFAASGTHNLLCGREDLDHLNEYVDSQQLTNLNDATKTLGNEEGMPDEVLFHTLARSMVDPLEFKEVKMLATECVAKFPPPLVMPFVLAYLIAFVREASPNQEQYCSIIVDEKSVPDSCGLVTAKLMVYYLNRVFSEDAFAYVDDDIISKALAVLVQILGLPCAQEGGDSLLTDLQRGCIDGFALILSRLAASSDSSEDDKKMPTSKASSLMNLLLSWIFGAKFGESIKEDQSAETLGRRVQHLLEKVWGEARHHEFPLQIRICCCNVLLSAISRSENNVLTSWKNQGVISRIALATEDCFEEYVIAGGLQIIFSFLYKASDILSMEDNGDLQLVYMCYEATATRLESTQSESVAMNGLKVVGALIGKLPAFIGTLPSAELQRLIDRCLITLRDRQVSPMVSELAQSLLQAMSPP